MSDDKERPDLSLNRARVYRNYLLTCRRIGIMTTSPERAKVLLDEWAAARRDVDPATGEVNAREPIPSDPPAGQSKVQTKTAPKGGSKL